MKIQRFVVTPGNLKHLVLRDDVLPPPPPGEVQVAVKAVGLNFADVFALWGLYKAAPKTDFTPGLEYAGVIEKVGEGVMHFQAGDRVMGITRFGGYTTGINIDARYIVPVPQAWSLTTAAAYLVQTLTAYYGLFNLGDLQPGQTVLIHSIAGGVGLQALKIAKAKECFVVGTVGDAGKVDLAEANGCNRVIVRGKNFEQDLRSALAGRPLHLVFDTVGGRYFSIPFRMLAPMGRLIVVGASRYASVGNRPNVLHMLRHFLTRPKVDPQSLPEQNKGLFGFNLIYLYERIELMPPMLKDLESMHLTAPHVGHVFPFEQLREAILLFQSGKTKGKVVLEVTGN
ncbi:MAG: zinc-binding dehydrogenase [Saprospirales bacterium]|jgi:NADPH:quinone reductase-like Zn-dependent oxidoreductase|nr:zinc-binding dehydrogenase [Saprospirales bacterium]